MPILQPTGNAQWDQNLATLGGALFPDPSKAAMAYYYGSESRNKQLEGNRYIGQDNARNRFLMMPFAAAGQGPAPAPPTFYQPQNVPGAAPILAPPSNLPMSGAQGQPLSSAIVGPSGGQPLPAPTMSPAQVTAQIGQSLDDHPNSPTNGGTAPPVSPPVPGAAPASNATGSNGTVPQNDLASAVLHPGSVTPPGGGVKYAGPANHDGSPAPMAVNLATYIATGTYAGFDAAQLAANGQAVLAQAVAEGRITPQQYHEQLAGVGAPQMGVADIGARSAANVAGIQAGAELAKQRIVTEEQRRQFDNPWQTVTGPDGLPHTVPRSVSVQSQPAQPAVPGQPAVPYEPEGTLAQPATPGKPAVPAGLGLPTYEPTVATTKQGQTGEFGQYVDPKNPGAPPVTTTAGDANARGLVKQATDPQQQIAALQQQWRLETDPVKKQALYQQLLALSAAPKAVTPEEYNAKRQVDYSTDQQIYAQPQTGVANFGVKDPVAFKPEAMELINVREAQLTNSGSQQQLYKNNPVLAHQTAVQQLVAEGLIQSPQEINQLRGPTKGRITSAGFSGDPRIGTVQVPGTAPGTPGVDHMMVGLTPKGVAALGAASISGAVSSTATTPAPAAPAAPVPPATPKPPVRVTSPSGRGFMRNVPEPPAPPTPALRTPAGRQGQGGVSAAPAPQVQLPNTGAAPTGGTGGGRGRTPPMSSVIPPAGSALPTGAIAAAPGVREGATGRFAQTGQPFVVHNGFYYPAPAAPQ